MQFLGMQLHPFYLAAFLLGVVRGQSEEDTSASQLLLLRRLPPGLSLEQQQHLIIRTEFDVSSMTQSL